MVSATAATELTFDVRDLCRASRRTPTILEVPAMMFLAIGGAGAPGDADFQHAIGALYSVAYTAKFTLKKSGGGTYKLPPLEGLYDAEAQTSFGPQAFDRVRWTLMIMQPPPVSRELIERASAEAARKHPELPIADVGFEEFAEGLCAQVLHVGPYGDEGPTAAALHRFIVEHGSVPRGLHHEIYLGDPRRSAPERLRTILRQPVERPAGQPYDERLLEHAAARR